MNGWIKLHRAILESDIWIMPPIYSRVWIWLLLHAGHQAKDLPSFNGKIHLEAGEFRTSYSIIAEGVAYQDEYGTLHTPSKQTIMRILGYFVDEKMIVLDASNKGTQISIVNWESYQSKSGEPGTQMERRWNADGTQDFVSDHAPNELQVPKNDKKVQEEVRTVEKSESASSDASSTRPSDVVLQEEIRVLLQSFTDGVLPLVHGILSLIASDNKTGKISDGRKLTELRAISKARDEYPTVFRDALTETVSRDKGSVPYLRKVCKSMLGRSPEGEQRRTLFDDANRDGNIPCPQCKGDKTVKKRSGQIITCGRCEGKGYMTTEEHQAVYGKKG